MALVKTIDKKVTFPASAVEISGARLLQVETLITKAASDSDGSVFFIAEVPDQAVIKSISLEGAAVTGLSAVDIGLYDVNGNEVDADVFLDGVDFSSVSGLPLGPGGVAIRQCMATLGATGLANLLKKVFELAGHVNKPFPGVGETNRLPKYRIGMKLVTAGGNAGSWIARTEYLMAV